MVKKAIKSTLFIGFDLKDNVIRFSNHGVKYAFYRAEQNSWQSSQSQM